MHTKEKKKLTACQKKQPQDSHSHPKKKKKKKKVIHNDNIKIERLLRASLVN